jgi:hypothetical protein
VLGLPTRVARTDLLVNLVLAKQVNVREATFDVIDFGCSSVCFKLSHLSGR